MQCVEFIALLLNKRIPRSAPRRPAGRPGTAHLLRWQLFDIIAG